MELFFFVAGIFFISYISPLLDQILTYLATWIESKKAKLAVIINETNQKIQASAASSDETSQVFGFGTYLEEKEEDDDDL